MFPWKERPPSQMQLLCCLLKLWRERVRSLSQTAAAHSGRPAARCWSPRPLGAFVENKHAGWVRTRTDLDKTVAATPARMERRCYAREPGTFPALMRFAGSGCRGGMSKVSDYRQHARNAAVLPRRRDFLSTGRCFSTWLPLGKHSPTIASRRRKGWGELPSSKTRHGGAVSAAKHAPPS
jgi:hypothetical protein